MKKWTQDELKLAVANSKTIAEVLRGLGLKVGSGNYDTINRWVKILSLDVSHFTGKSHGKSIPPSKILTKDLFTSDSNFGRTVVKRRVLKDNLIPYECIICGLKPLWNGKPLRLILDHENGIWNDHRLENLRFLCPNCNSQQPTFCKGNKI